MEKTSDPVVEKIEFKGTTKEWFGIWIVNLLLSIVTLGIYSAWAKVRRNKYFYNNTYIGDRNFDYHATGRQIFMGRLLIVALVTGLNLLSRLNFNEILSLTLALLFYLSIPWLIVRAITFNARMSSWSNIRFNFKGTTLKAYLVFYIYPFLTLLTLYTAFPFQYQALKKFSFNNYFLGTSRFSIKCPIGPLYVAFGACLIWITVTGTILGIFGYIMGDYISAIYLTGIIGIIPLAFLYKAMVRNAIYNSISLEDNVRFRSTIIVPELLLIIISNMIVIVCSLGFMLPWTKIRLTKYLADHTKVILNQSLDDFTGTQLDKIDTLGDAYTDVEGIDNIDIDIGL